LETWQPQVRHDLRFKNENHRHKDDASLAHPLSTAGVTGQGASLKDLENFALQMKSLKHF
jgi:hypothetical protein